MDATWPPTGETAVLLGQLAEMIERGGAAHLLDAAVVRADERDFPEAWQPTAAAVERLLARLLWHAHVDLDVAIDDLRGGGGASAMLSRSAIVWIETIDGVAAFQIEVIGNDNVAGALSHEVGRAYLGWIAAATPYRDDRAPPSERDGTIAAVYLGLGVVAANASAYQRTAGKLIGQTAVTEWDVVVTGGLATQDILYLLAVQAVLRGASIAAHATLRSAELRDRLAGAIAELSRHRDAIAAHLGVDLDATRPTLERDPAPATVADADRPEPDARARFTGQRTYRLKRSKLASRAALGLLAGVAITGTCASIFGVLPTSFLAVMIAPAFLGGAIGARNVSDYCTRCGVGLAADATRCVGCGATVAGRVDREADVHARELEHDD